MKFIISSAALLKATTDMSKAIPSKSTLPILENFLLSLENDKLQIMASDSELTMRTELPVDSSEGEGKIAVPAKHIMELLKELPDQPVTIQTVKENYFECNWMGGTSTLPYFNADEYPRFSGTDDSASRISFPAQTLVDGINNTIYATDDDEMRPVMSGILFDISANGTTLVASDSRKLICFTTGDVKSEDQSGFILHKKPAGILRSVIGKDCENVEIAYDGKNAMFAFGNTVVVCRLIVGKYPRYKDVIPQNNSNVLRIERLRLLNCVKRISVCANKANDYVKADIRSNSIEVSAQDLGFSISAHEKISCQYDGEEMQVGFKSAFLIDILGNLSCDEVVLKLSDPRRAALLMPEDEDKSEKIFAVMMPVQI